MARGGARTGAGRKRLPDKRVAILVRVPAALRAELEQAAEEAGRSLSKEVEHRLLEHSTSRIPWNVIRTTVGHGERAE
jgi:hypothetical protein